MCHHNTFLIYSSIERADQRRWDLVTHISLAISLAVSVLFGVAGYATFRGFSQGNLFIKRFILCKFDAPVVELFIKKELSARTTWIRFFDQIFLSKCINSRIVLNLLKVD